jgi:hypothetical protein
LSVTTKLFVVLLVICSLLMTAALVIFINTVEPYRVTAEQRKVEIDRLKGQLDSANSEAVGAKSREEKAVADKNAAAATAQTEVAALKQQLGTRDVSINDLNTKLAISNANVSTLTSAQAAALKSIDGLQKRHDADVGELDKIRLANAELTGANTDFQKRLDESVRELRWLAEQNTQIKSDLASARNLLSQHNIPLDNAAGRKVVAAPNLKGVIKATRVNDGILYATISLGSTDKVEKGMTFRVINQNTMEFLGNLTVELVDTNESFGRLEGPKVQEVKPDFQVLSQL